MHFMRVISDELHKNPQVNSFPFQPKEKVPPLASATKKYPKTHPARDVEEKNNTQVLGLELRFFFFFSFPSRW